MLAGSRSSNIPAPTPATSKEFAQLRELAGRGGEPVAADYASFVNQLHNRLARVFPELALDVAALRATWVLRLLEKYPSPAKIAGAHLSSLLSIPHMTSDKAQKIQAAAAQTVASLQGAVAEGLIRQSVRSIQHSQKPRSAVDALAGRGLRRLASGTASPARDHPRDRQADRCRLGGQNGQHRPISHASVGRQLFRGLSRREQLRRGQIRPTCPPGHHAHESQGKRPGSKVFVERGEGRHAAQSGRPFVVRSATGARQTWRRGLGALHAETVASGLRRLEDRSAVCCASGRNRGGTEPPRPRKHNQPRREAEVRVATAQEGEAAGGPQRTKSRKASGHPGAIQRYHRHRLQATLPGPAGTAGPLAAGSTSRSKAQTSQHRRGVV